MINKLPLLEINKNQIDSRKTVIWEIKMLNQDV